jgi:hypothetical protein
MTHPLEWMVHAEERMTNSEVPMIRSREKRGFWLENAVIAVG